MQINFFEEFPEGLDKAKLIDFPCTIFIAAKSLEDFQKYKNKLKKLNKRITPAYWPILERSYWISPFSYTDELLRLYEELKDFDGIVLIDLEFPFRRKDLLFRNIFSFFTNKKLIKKILNKKNTYTAEYPLGEFKKRLFGLSYNNKNKIIMYYASLIKNNYLKNKIKKLIIKTRPIVGLGCIATGIFGNEPILNKEELEKDLKFLKQNKINNCVIFRLGGMNKEFSKVINSVSQ